jgi:hypothetical protein
MEKTRNIKRGRVRDREDKGGEEDKGEKGEKERVCQPGDGREMYKET